MDDSLHMTPTGRDRSPLGTLVTAPRLLAAVTVMLLVLAGGLGRLPWAEALGIGALVCAAAIVLERMLARREAPQVSVEVDHALDPDVSAFADILFDPYIVINERSVVVYCNPAARAMFPRLRVGEPLSFTLRDPDIVEAIARARRSGGRVAVEIHATVPHETWFRISTAPLAPLRPGAPGLVLLSLTDLTEQRRTDQLRADFVANASHELRTPLTSLIGFIETLQGPAARDEAARTRFLAIMRAQSERMSALIDDLLSLSRIEQRQHLRPTARVVLNPLLREIAEGMELRAREDGLEIVLDVPDTEVAVIGERIELCQVIENLLDNAIKYGAGGGRVELRLEAATSETRGAHRIIVRDHGPGIAEEHVPRLTERFYRVEGDSGRRRKGTGLGLAIVKHVVSRHHGQLVIRSRIGDGTHAEVLLPAA